MVDVARKDAGRFTYRQMNARATALAGWLRDVAGVQRGDRVGIVALNGVEHLDLLFACGKLGAIFVPYNWRLHAAELTEGVRSIRPRVLLFGDDFRDAAAQVREHVGDSLRLVSLDAQGLPGADAYATALGHVSSGAGDERGGVRGGHPLPHLHRRHHRAVQGREGVLPHGGVEHAQHAGARDPTGRRDGDAHAAVPHRRAARVHAAAAHRGRHRGADAAVGRGRDAGAGGAGEGDALLRGAHAVPAADGLAALARDGLLLRALRDERRAPCRCRCSRRGRRCTRCPSSRASA